MIRVVGEYRLQNEVQTNLGYTENSQERNRKKMKKESLASSKRNERQGGAVLFVLHVD